MRQTHRKEEALENMQAEIGVMHLQAKETKDCWKPLEARRGRKDPALESSERPRPADSLIPDSWSPDCVR